MDLVARATSRPGSYNGIQRLIFGLTITLLILTNIFVGLRLYVRLRMVKTRLALDDGFLFFSLVSWQGNTLYLGKN